MTSYTSRIYVDSCVEVEVPVPNNLGIYMMEFAVFEVKTSFRVKETCSSNKLRTRTFATSAMHLQNLQGEQSREVSSAAC